MNTLATVLRNKEELMELIGRSTTKIMMETMIIAAYNLGDCPSAYDVKISTPVIMRLHDKLLGLE